MSDITLTGSGDFSRLKQEYDKLQRENVKLQGKLREVGEASKTAAKDSEAAFGRIGRASKDLSLRGILADNMAGIQSMLTGLVGAAGVQQAVGVVRQAYTEWRQQIKEVAKEHSAMVQGMLSGLAATGDLAAAPKIEAGLEQVQATAVVTKKEAQAAWAGVRGELPTATVDRALEVTGAAARAAPLMSEEDLGKFGKLTAQVSEMMPTLDPQKLAGMSLKLKQLAGNEAEALVSNEFEKASGTLQAAGLSAEQALGLGVSAARSGFGAKLLMGIASEIGKPQETTAVPRGRRLTAEEQARAKFAAASPAERLAMLRSDPAVAQAALGERALQFKQIAGEGWTEAVTALQQAQAGDFIGSQVALAAKAPGGPERMMGRLQAIEEERAAIAASGRGRAMERATKELNTQTLGQGPLARFEARRALEGGEFWSATLGTEATGMELGARASRAGRKMIEYGPPTLALSTLFKLVAPETAGKFFGEGAIKRETEERYTGRESEIAAQNRLIQQQIDIQKRILEETMKGNARRPPAGVQPAFSERVG